MTMKWKPHEEVTSQVLLEERRRFYKREARERGEDILYGRTDLHSQPT